MKVDILGRLELTLHSTRNHRAEAQTQQEKKSGECTHFGDRREAKSFKERFSGPSDLFSLLKLYTTIDFIRTFRPFFSSVVIVCLNTSRVNTFATDVKG